MDERDSPTQNQDYWTQNIRKFSQASPGPLPGSCEGLGTKLLGGSYRAESDNHDSQVCHQSAIESPRSNNAQA